MYIHIFSRSKSFLSYVEKILNMAFAAKLIILLSLLQFLTQTLEIFKLKRNNYYLTTEIEKYVSFLLG